jgi:hypothetical protein
MTSPARPIACESEPDHRDRPEIVQQSPRPAIVDGRIRLSANARSSGTAEFRWWQTISMSRCSLSVLRVYGRVGLVDDGSTFGCEATVMMSGACPPPAPSV